MNHTNQPIRVRVRHTHPKLLNGHNDAKNNLATKMARTILTDTKLQTEARLTELILPYL